jgi:hypothetical protein
MRDILSAPIPLSVVMFLIIQTMGFVWWGSNVVNTIAARVSAVELTLANVSKTADSHASHEGRIIVLEQGVFRVRDDLAEIKTLLRRIDNAPASRQP